MSDLRSLLGLGPVLLFPGSRRRPQRSDFHSSLIGKTSIFGSGWVTPHSDRFRASCISPGPAYALYYVNRNGCGHAN